MIRHNHLEYISIEQIPASHYNRTAPSFSKKRKVGKMKRKYIHYPGSCKIYAIYYRNTKTMYYNLDFDNSARIIVIK